MDSQNSCKSEQISPTPAVKRQQSSYLNQKISIDRRAAYELLKNVADELKFYYSCIETKSAFGPRFCHASSMTWRAVTVIEPILEEVATIAHQYDFDPQVSGNGIRSIGYVIDSCVLHLIRIFKEIQEQRSSLLFRANHYVKELEAFVSAQVVLVKAVERVFEFLPLWPKNDLFDLTSDPDRRLINLMSEIESLDQAPFFGRAMGFQFCASLSRVFQVIGISLASYSLLWDANRPAATSLTGAASNLLTSGSYVINPEERARRIYQVTINTDIAFCKAFWNLTEGRMLQELPRWFSPQLAVNEIWQIPGELSLWLETNDGRQGEVPPPTAHTGPRNLPVRVMSNHYREGMPTQNVARVFKRAGTKANILPRSPCLVFHVHGGGFVATSSKTHEPYLRHWAKSLNCPVVSVDYSLAPENPYPRAAEEVYYAYAWVLANAERLGWTGERVCFAGDSAGGLLLASTVLRLIKRNVRRLPDGLVLIYPAFLVKYSPSPSRLLSLIDPLLPLGILTRCIAAYTGNIEFLKPETATASPSQNASGPSAAEASPNTAPKRTLRDVVNDLYAEEQKRDPTASTASCSSQGDEEILNFFKQTYQPEKPTFGTEFATDATTDEASIDTTDPNESEEKATDFVMESASSDEEEDEGAKFGSDTGFGQFFHRQLSRTSGGRLRSQSAIGLPLSETQDTSADPSPLGADMERGLSSESIASANIPPRDPNCIVFTASHFDESFLNFLQDAVATRASFRRFTVPLTTSRSLSDDRDQRMAGSPSLSTATDERNPAAATRERSPSSGHVRSQSASSLASITRASAAIGHKMGLYVMDNLSGWFSTGQTFETKNIFNGTEETTSRRPPSPPGGVPLSSPLSKFHDMHVPADPFLSPLLAPDEWLAKFPRTAVVACHFDPLLDDSVTFAKRLKRVGVNVSLDLIDSLPHGFLNFAMFSPECREGARVCVQRMREILITRERS